MSAIDTLAPVVASSWAVARPIPDAPPAITALLWSDWVAQGWAYQSTTYNLARE